MKVLLTGANGQLGRALGTVKPDSVELTTFSRESLDITDYDGTSRIIEKHKPDIFINAAAYTAVENAEQNKDRAFEVNSIGVKNISKISKSNNVKLVHISTDYVFDGTSVKPYKEDSEVNPINVYGKSKLAGENHALNIMESNLILFRTAWLYSYEGPSFLTTIMRLLKQRKSINVVNDQRGTPTRSISLAKAIYRSIDLGLEGIFNYTDAGDASWFEFASEIKDILQANDPKTKLAEILPVASDYYSSEIERPKYTVLAKTKISYHIECNNWRESLKEEIMLNYKH